MADAVQTDPITGLPIAPLVTGAGAVAPVVKPPAAQQTSTTTTDFIPPPSAATSAQTTTAPTTPPADTTASAAAPTTTDAAPVIQNSAGDTLAAPPGAADGDQAYADWRAKARSQGFTNGQIIAASKARNTAANAAQVATSSQVNPVLNSATQNVTDIGGWKPGDVYSGTSTPGSTSDKSFIPADSGMGPGPTNWTVTADQTVQGQMDKLTQNIGTNPVYQSLAAQLTRENAAHGGTNSLMAETAAYNQVVGLAYNIATNDAATYAKSAEFNASMANQFGLAAQQFHNTALLSDQNYKQSQVLQAEQINGNLQSVSMQIAGQLASTRIAADAQMNSAGISANAQITSSTIGANASMTNAKLSAETSLKEATLQHQTTLDSLQIQFQSQWSLQQGAQGNALQQGAQNQYYATQNATTQFGHQLTLQNNTEMNANLRQLSAGVAQIGATPGLTAQQQAAGIATLTGVYKTNNELTNSAYASATHGISNGSAAGSSTGNYSLNPPPGPGTNPSDPYNQYGNYMAYPGYEITAPPTLPFFGGSGLADVGKQPGSPNDFYPPTSSGTPQWHP